MTSIADNSDINISKVLKEVRTVYASFDNLFHLQIKQQNSFFKFPWRSTDIISYKPIMNQVNKLW